MRFLTIDEPNADELDPGTGTFIHAISNNDEMVGSYWTNIDDFGFSDIGGSFTALWGPLIATDREANGVNNSGEVVGYYVDPTYHYHGFLFSGGNYKTLNEPKANNDTVAEGINNAGKVVGYYFDGSEFHGFLDVNGTFATLDDPLANSTVPSFRTSMTRAKLLVTIRTSTTSPTASAT